MPAAHRPFRARHRLTALTFCFSLCLLGCSQEASRVTPTVGMELPNLVFKTFDGREKSLEDYRGRLLLLNVWAPWCAPCLDEMPSLERLSRKLDRERFAVIGLTVGEERFLAEEFLMKQGISFSNYLDEKRQVVEDLLAVHSFPQTFVISPQRRLLARVVGWQDWDTPEVVEALERQYRAAAEKQPGGDSS